ncbi:MAG TPA: glycosyl transferase [Bacteroidales bacterium]|nr:glycosyl transferase [Bacteroidales bacterium]
MIMNSDQNKLPLVTVIITTYNSSGYVLETLESAGNQTYQNIELIVTDDCSGDKTVEICRSWIEKNKGKFVKAEVITTKINTGIAPNQNRAIKSAGGEWIKIIAGDDILLSNCIESNVSFVLNSSEPISFLFSRHIWFKLNSYGKKMTCTNEKLVNEYWNKLDRSFFKADAKKQYLKLLKGNRIPASTAFFNKETLIKLGGFDERFPMIDDYPLWIKATRNNYKLHFNDIETVLYRKHEDEISNSKKINARYSCDNYSFYKAYRINRYTVLNPFLHLSVNLNYLNHKIILKSGKYTLINRILRIMDPNFIKQFICPDENVSAILNESFSENKNIN